ncbi:unnamed protein product, partial [Musa banksii]
GKRRHRLAPAHRSGRELGPTPPTIKLEKDVEGIVDEAEEEPLSVLCLTVCRAGLYLWWRLTLPLGLRGRPGDRRVWA